MNMVPMELVIQEGIKHRPYNLKMIQGPCIFLPAAEQCVTCVWIRLVWTADPEPAGTSGEGNPKGVVKEEL